MIFIDLDNTLYNQEQYLIYAFKEIGKFIESEYKVNYKIIYNYLLNTAKIKTMHYPIFNSLVKEFKINIDPKELVNMYRELSMEYLEKNKLFIYKSALHLLKNYEIIIYTEGRKDFQEAKIKNIEKNYKIKLNYIIVENKLDEKNNKIFEKYKPDIYIGDDLYKDFYIPNKLGVLTIRVLTGLYKNIPNDIVEEMYRPKITIRNLKFLKYI